MPTRTGIATVVTAVLGLIAGRVFGIFELYIVGAVMIALVVCATLWVVLNWRSLEVSRNVSPPRLHAGSMSTVTLNLSNTRMLPTPVARITDEVQGATRADAHVPPLRRDSSTRASYRVPTEQRGLIDIGPMKTTVVDPFGLASSTRSTAPDTSLLVLPKVHKVPAPPQPGGELAHQIDRAPNRVGPNGDDFSSLRPYAMGDDLRKVHWPSSARSDDLVVRTEHVPEHGHSMVLLDVRGSSSDADTFELMVSAAASIITACHNRGDRIRFATTAGLDMVADTTSAFAAMLDQLALIQQASSPTINLPFQLGSRQADVGALVVANDAETLITKLPSRVSGVMNTFVVRFQCEGARAHLDSSRLPSNRMIDIRQGEDFAAAWTQRVGIAAARSS